GARPKNLSRRQEAAPICLHPGSGRFRIWGDRTRHRGLGAAGETDMKFMLTFAIKPEAKGRDEAIARFNNPGGPPPKGAKPLGRWTAADFSGGFDLIESDDIKAMTEFALMWSDIMELKFTPVIEDAALGEVLKRIGT